VSDGLTAGLGGCSGATAGSTGASEADSFKQRWSVCNQLPSLHQACINPHLSAR